MNFQSTSASTPCFFQVCLGMRAKTFGNNHNASKMPWCHCCMLSAASLAKVFIPDYDPAHASIFYNRVQSAQYCALSPLNEFTPSPTESSKALTAPSSILSLSASRCPRSESQAPAGDM